MASFLKKFNKKGKNSMNTQIRCVAGDIVSIGTDIIVNAANSHLRAGGGVCGAIFKGAGMQQLQQACDVHGNCPTGSAVITPAFNLEKFGTKHIIHAVGPQFSAKRAEECDRELVSAYRSALRLAESVGARSIAIPAISTGIFDFPAERAAPLVAALLTSETFDLDEIVLMALEPKKIALYADALA
jgi:O-acetyl-ADP-ribose deacetylase (regulator of RNase III)